MNTPTPLTGIEAMTVMYQEEYELRVQKEKELAAALDLQAAYFARCEQLCDALSAAQERAEKAEAERDRLKECVWKLRGEILDMASRGMYTQKSAEAAEDAFALLRNTTEEEGA